MDRPAGCLCVDGRSPICPARHDVPTRQTPVPGSWVERAMKGELPANVTGGVVLSRHDRPIAQPKRGAHV